MGIELFELSGNVLMVVVSGQLKQPELAEVQQAASTIIRIRDKVRMLVIAEDFQGWNSEDDWGDLSFQDENDAKIERIAIVGDREWKDLAITFAGRGFRDFPIEFFEHGQMAKARAWLLTKPGSTPPASDSAL
jgi:hypothetical protein